MTAIPFLVHAITSAITVLAGLAAPAGAVYINGSVIAPCDSPIYCHGEILKQIELARPFADSKTFVDMPALKPLQEIQAAFDLLEKPLSNNTALHEFLASYFGPPGNELSPVDPATLHTNATFLSAMDDTVIREFLEKVIAVWPSLTRRYSPSGTCAECPNSYLALSRPFIIAGGRFREPYYWDSYWTMLGLLRTGGSFIEIARNQIENFLDFVERFGFVPNGARMYYLDRSQPPMLALMVREYVDATGDTSILERAVPLLVDEHDWWMTNRKVDVVMGDTTYTLNRYAVLNTVPRPESYREDYLTVTNTSYHAADGIIYPENTTLNETEQESLYGELATGAESGWDYTARWLSRPADAMRDNYFPLRSLNVHSVVPVDLNSILYADEMAIAKFLSTQGNSTAAQDWQDRAQTRSRAMEVVMWNATMWRYFDYNLTAGAQAINMPVAGDGNAGGYDDLGAGGVRCDPEQVILVAPQPQPQTPNLADDGGRVIFTVAQFFPFWTGAAPEHLRNNPLAVQRAFAPVAKHLALSAGGVPATNFPTTQQWDRPNVWPPLMHVLMQGLLNTPATFGEDDPAYRQVRALALSLAQRYIDSTFCTWHATGGSTSETPAPPGFEDSGGRGVMFEKYRSDTTDAAGGGGEYEVVEGFGWTNGVAIWVGDTFGTRRGEAGEAQWLLKRPQCRDVGADEAVKLAMRRSL